MIKQVISNTEYEVTVKLENGKIFSVYSSKGDQINLLLDLLYREASKTIGENNDISLAFSRSLEDTDIGFKRIG